MIGGRGWERETSDWKPADAGAFLGLGILIILSRRREEKKAKAVTFSWGRGRFVGCVVYTVSDLAFFSML